MRSHPRSGSVLSVLKATGVAFWHRWGWGDPHAAPDTPRSQRARQKDFVQAFLSEDRAALERAAAALGPELQRPETWAALNLRVAELGLSLLGHAVSCALTAHGMHQLLLDRRGFMNVQHQLGLLSSAQIESLEAFVEPSPLEKALQEVDVQCGLVERLLSWGCPPDGPRLPDGPLMFPRTPLQQALGEGCERVASLLIKAGADVHRKAPLGLGGGTPVSALRHALAGGQRFNPARAAIVQRLLDQGVPATAEDLAAACAHEAPALTGHLKKFGHSVDEGDNRAACILAVFDAGAPLSPAAWNALSASCLKGTEPPGLMIALEQRGVVWPLDLERWLTTHVGYAPEVARCRAHRAAVDLERELPASSVGAAPRRLRM